MNLFNRPVAQFKTESGKEILIFRPTLDRLPILLRFTNRLIAEDTYLNLTGRAKTYQEEESWLRGTLADIKSKKSLYFWAVSDGKIVGSVSVNHGYERSWHVGKIGLMVDRDFRRDGIGTKLLEFILKEAQDFEIKMSTLEVFKENFPAIKLYKKFDFRVYGRLPGGLFRKGKFSDTIEMYKKLD